MTANEGRSATPPLPPPPHTGPQVINNDQCQYEFTLQIKGLNCSCCSDRQTCCMSKTFKYQCCPVPVANCCLDREICCPYGWTCHVYSTECIKPAKLCRSLLHIPVIQVFGTAGNDHKVGRSVIFSKRNKQC